MIAIPFASLIAVQKDFAGRGRSTKRKRPARPRKQSPRQRVLFHGPSFSSGAIVGAAIVIVAAYAPELLRDSPQQTAAAPSATPEQKIRFEFPDILRRTEVRPDPETYRVPDGEAAPPQGFYIQAASFREKDDADQLRARLLLSDLPARTRAADNHWFRVIVGPFDRKVAAQRAMTALREQNLQPMWLNDHN